MKKIAICALALFPIRTAEAAHLVSDYHHCQTGDLKCVHKVVTEMNKRFRKLAKACDHDLIFALVYLRTTEMYGATAATLGYDDVSSVTREDALFADYYFRAYDNYHNGSGDVPAAWQIAFDAAAAHELTAAGNAFLGINAHIQRDLPFTLYELYTQGHPVSYHDHNLVNVFLAQVQPAAAIAGHYDPSYPLDGNSDLIFWWREIAWQNYLLLRDAPSEEARAVVAQQIEDAAAIAAASFADATAYPPGTDSSARDAYCEANN